MREEEREGSPSPSLTFLAGPPTSPATRSTTRTGLTSHKVASEIVARFQLTPDLWFAASRHLLQRQRRWLSPRTTWPLAALLLASVLLLDRSRWFDEGLLPVLVLLNLILLLAGGLLLLTPFLIRRRFHAVYHRLPMANRAVVWRFSPFRVSAEGGLTRFDGGWDELREIVATPDFFLVSRKEQSAGVIPVSAFEDAQAVDDFVYLAKTYGPSFVEASP